MTYQTWSVVFGEQPSAAKWNILGGNDAHFYSFLGDNLAWSSWSPSYTNITIGSGTTVAQYIQIGKTIFFNWQLLLNTTTINDNISVSLPVTAASRYGTANMTNAIGTGYYNDITASQYPLVVTIEASTTVFKVRVDVQGTPDTGSTNNPVAEANGDTYSVSGFYEAA